MARNWEPKSALTVPSSSDDNVEKAAAWLEGKLFRREVIHDNTAELVRDNIPVGGGVEDSLNEATMLLQIAANITALDANRLVSFQNYQFDIIKLCDSWNLMLTSYKIGANDILEKLHVVYLKLLEGFPDLAKQDLVAVSKHVNGMILAAEKARRTFSQAKHKMRDDYESMHCAVEKKEQELQNRFQQMQADVKQELKRNCFDCGENERIYTRSESNEKFLSELDELRYDHQRNLNGSVAKESLGLVLKKVEHAEVPLLEAENLARTWYFECRNVVEQTMKENIAETKKMAAKERREFWEKLPFVQQAFCFLCRWKALYQLCSSHLTKIRHVRQKADALYMENLLPREAVEKAWGLVANNVDLRHIKRFPVISKQDRCLTIGDQRYSLDHLLEVQTIDEAVTSNVRENTFGAKSYALILTKIQKLGRYLEVLSYLLPEVPSELQNLQRRFVEICRLIVDMFDAFDTDAVDFLLSLHIACNCWIRGLHSFLAKELQTPLLRVMKVQALANAVSFFCPATSITKPLSDILERTCREREKSEDTITYPWMGVFGLEWCRHYLKQVYMNASHQQDSSKRLAMALEVVGLINGYLPLTDAVKEFVGIGLRVFGTIEEITPPGTKDDVTPSDWKTDVVKCYSWIQSFRIVCREEVTGLNWFRDHQQMPQAKRTWGDCVRAIANLEDNLLMELAEKVETNVEKNLIDVDTWEKSAISQEPVMSEIRKNSDNQTQTKIEEPSTKLVEGVVAGSEKDQEDDTGVDGVVDDSRRNVDIKMRTETRAAEGYNQSEKVEGLISDSEISTEKKNDLSHGSSESTCNSAEGEGRWSSFGSILRMFGVGEQSGQTGIETEVAMMGSHS